MANIFVVDDEENICKLIENTLKRDGHVVICRNNVVGLEAKDFKMFDLILLDVMMPEMDGFSFCRSIREDVDCPILFLTAKTMEEDMIEGLSLGGDDYIKKPFSLSELRARVFAHLRREYREHHQMLVIGTIRLDLSGKKIVVNESEIPLTKSEYEICIFLARNKGQVFSLEHILEHTLGFDSESDVSAIRVHVKNIREKFSRYIQCPIETVWGMGYRWK